MKKRDKKSDGKQVIDRLGRAARAVYLEQNPHGYARTHKVHKNGKKYSRKDKHDNGYN